jgi:beta-phosphoglucomutase-like phosphatase (HAD superfamily)
MPQDCIVFEDSPKGVEAAANAGMKAVVITITHTKKNLQSITMSFLLVKAIEIFKCT